MKRRARIVIALKTRIRPRYIIEIPDWMSPTDADHFAAAAAKELHRQKRPNGFILKIGNRGSEKRFDRLLRRARQGFGLTETRRV